MRQSSIILMMLMMLVIHVFSQQPAFSIKAGLNPGKWELGERASQFENKFKIGLHTGVNADIPVTPRITVQSELQYAMFGSVFTSENQTARYKANYLLLPVMAKYNLDNGLSFLCGPQVGVLVSAKTVINGVRSDFRDEVNKTDVFLVLGFDYKLEGGISMGFRYQGGLRSMEDEEDTVLKNQGFSLNLSYRLGNGFREFLDKLF